MLKRSRIFISAVLVAVLSVSALVLSTPSPSHACPVDPPPVTLLALYLESDLIVVAEITSEKDGEIISDSLQHFNLEVERKLKVLSTLKGSPPANLVFTKSEYRSKNNVQTESSGEEEEEFVYTPYGYKGFSELALGERYLFFFFIDSKTGKYVLTDEVSGAKRLADYDLDVHTKRLKELQSIQKLKKNQLEALTKWLVRCVEEPSTRWDGIFDLQKSFEALDDEEDGDADSRKENLAESFRLDKNFTGRMGAIAGNLSERQKERLSNTAFSELQQNPSLLDIGYFYYSPTGLAARWDKARLAMYLFGILQAAEQSDVERTGALMNYLSYIIDDEKLTDMANSFPTSDAETTENSAESDDAEAVNETAVNRPDAPQTEKQNIENEIETPATKALPKAKKLTPAEIRKNIFRDFVNRYQYLLANGFQVEEAEETEPPEVAEN